MAGERALPGLGLKGYWTLGSNGYKPDLDTDLQTLSAVTQLSVLSQTTALPGAPTDGMIYIVVSTDPTNPNKVAIRDNGAWVYITPLTGWMAFVKDTAVFMKYTGTAWVTMIPAQALSALSDVNITGLADGMALLWNVATTKWKASAISAQALSALSDVNITGLSDGMALLWNVATTKWKASAIPTGLISMPADVTATTYSVVNGDLAGDVIRKFDNASTMTVTVPSGLTNKQPFTLIQKGVGQVTITAASGVTINSADSKLKLRVQFSSATLIPSTTADTYYLVGDLAL